MKEEQVDAVPLVVEPQAPRGADVRRGLGRDLLQAFTSELVLLAAALWLLLTHPLSFVG